MPNKGFKLAAIIIITHIIYMIGIIFLPEVVDFSFTGGYSLIGTPFSLIYGLIVPVILITQFPHKPILKYLGIFIIVFNILRPIIIILATLSPFLFLAYTIMAVNIIGLLGFAIIAMVREKDYIIGLYLIQLFIISLYESIFVRSFILNAWYSHTTYLVLLAVIPMILFYISLIFLIYIVVTESNKSIDQSRGLI